MAPMASRVSLSLKPQSNCEPYSEGGEANFAASCAAAGSEIRCHGPCWAETTLTNGSGMRICAKIFIEVLPRISILAFQISFSISPTAIPWSREGRRHRLGGLSRSCLLYTSDAADEEDSVD